MKETFWQHLMGIVFLGLVALLAGSAPSLIGKAHLVSAVAIGPETKQRVVVVDAGHGGNDPGKVGVDGQLEKEINLAVAKKIKYYLEANDIAVVLTREDDQGLYQEQDTNKKSADMRKRVELINQAMPEVMISIHQNSYPDAQIKGPQVFYYQGSEEGAKFATLMQQRFNDVLGAASTRQAKANDNYYLLLNSKPVSVIVECGFLSNPDEARKLADPVYQDKIAWTVAMGTMAYLNKK